MATWTRERILREILGRDTQGLEVNLIGGDDGVEPKLYQAACRIFGSWTNAVVAAGLPPTRARAKQEWSPAKIIAVIRSLARRRHPLSARDVRKRYGALVPAARRCFGSWSKAIYAARVDPQRLQRGKNWSKERVVECILLKVIRNEPLVRKLVEPPALADAGTRLFGSWQAALDAAGVSESPLATPAAISRTAEIVGELHQLSDAQLALIQHRAKSPWSDREIFAAAIQRYRSGARMNGTLVQKEQRGLYRAAIDRFGRWRNVMAAAGLTSPTDKSPGPLQGNCPV